MYPDSKQEPKPPRPPFWLLYLYSVKIFQMISKKRKIFFFADKFSLHNMADYSGLWENVYPSNFFSNVHIYNIINYY